MVKLDGVEYKDITYSDLKVEIRRSSGGFSYNYSSKITIIGKGFKYLQSKLFADCNGWQNSVDIEITSPCGVRYNGVVYGNAVEEYDDVRCSAVINVTGESDAENVYKKLLGVPVSKFNPRPYFVKYCKDLSGIAFILAAIWNILFLSIQLINGIAQLLGFDSITEGIDNIRRYITGCYFYHQTYNVWEVIRKAIESEGLVFESSIESDYSNLTISCPTIIEGKFDITEIAENKLSQDVWQMLEQFGILFNAKWEIYQGKVTFEPINVDNRIVLLNVEDYNNYYYLSYADKKEAYGDYSYSSDGIDWRSNEIIKEYDDIIEWNPQGLGSLQGSKKVRPNLSLWKMWDDVKRNQSDEFRKSLVFGSGTRDTNVALMSTGTCSVCKIGIVSRIENSRVVRFDRIAVRNKFLYSPRLRFKENIANALYEKYHYISEPSNGISMYVIPEIEIDASGDVVQSILNLDGVFSIQTRYGIGYGFDVTIDLITNVCTFTNVKINCI